MKIYGSSEKPQIAVFQMTHSITYPYGKSFNNFIPYFSAFFLIAKKICEFLQNLGIKIAEMDIAFYTI